MWSPLKCWIEPCPHIQFSQFTQGGLRDIQVGSRCPLYSLIMDTDNMPVLGQSKIPLNRIRPLLPREFKSWQRISWRSL